MNIMGDIRPLHALSIFLLMHVTLATNSTKSMGCKLIKPESVQNRLEPEKEPLLIYLIMERLRIRDVPVSGGSFGLEFVISMSWEDNRYIVGNEGRKIGCKSNYVKWTEANQFWLPNFFVWDVIEMNGCLREQNKPGAMGDEYLYYNVTSGNFQLWTICHARIRCQMDFSLYPFDTQRCLFAMSPSNEESPIYMKVITTLQYETNTNTTEMFKLAFKQIENNVTYWNSSVPGFTLSLERVPYPFFINTYLPTTLLTVISFIGFVIPVDKVPGRMALLVTVFLMLVNISSNERSRGPMTSNFTALDIWLLLCMIFVALALFEYALLLAIRFGKQSKIHGIMIGIKDDAAVVGKCHKIDLYALRVFIVLHNVLVIVYISFIHSYPEDKSDYIISPKFV